MSETALPTLRLESVSAERPEQRFHIANRDPAPGAERAGRRSTITAEVFDLTGAFVDGTAVQLSVDGALAYDGARTPDILDAFAGPRARVEPGPGVLRITLDPRQAFQSEAALEVRLTVGAGTDALESSWRFRVEDYRAPTLLAAEATSPTTLALSFDEPVVAETIDARFVARGGPAVPLTFMRADGAGARVELLIQPEMTPGALYEVRVLGAQDAAGNGASEGVAAFRGYRVSAPPERRFDLWRMLPVHARRADETTDLLRFIRCLQEVVDLLLVDIDRMTTRIDIERAPEAAVELWLRDLGSPFELVFNDLDRRRLASVLVDLYRLKGTERGMRSAARLLLGVELEEITTFSGTPLVLGESLLGVDWELGPSNRFALYAFSVRVARLLTDDERRRLRTLILWCKPAHTHLVEILEPIVVTVPDHWELGEAELGLTTILG